MTEHAPDLDATHARQGLRGRHVFRILVISLTLSVVALIAAWIGFSGHPRGPMGEGEAPPAVARTVTTTPAPAKQTSLETNTPTNGVANGVR